MHIVKRKKGKQEYYYLQISQRKKGKVINKEVYLGKTIPKDIEKIKESLEQEQIKELKDQLREQVKSLPE